MNQYHNYEALRKNYAVINVSETHFILKVSGPDATDFLNRILPSKIYYLQPHTALSTLLLNSDCKIIDIPQLIYVENFYYWLGARSSKEATLNFLHSQNSTEVMIEDLEETVQSFSVEGPYAWKKVGEMLGSEALGLRIYGAMPFEMSGHAGICIRSGWTGEYAYRLIFSLAMAPEILQKLNEPSVVPVLSQEEVILASQETRTPLLNGTIHEGDDPFEQDLRYMIDFGKEEYLFHSVLQEKIKEMEESTAESVVAIKIQKGEVKTGDNVFIDGVSKGKILSVTYSPRAEAIIGYAKLEKTFAHPGIRNFLLKSGTSVESLSSPLIQTLSTTVHME